jgi:uncharacterized protein (DUF1778 family)
MEESERKSLRLDVRLSQQEQELLDRLRAHLGLSRSATVTFAIRELARREGLLETRAPSHDA